MASNRLKLPPSPAKRTPSPTIKRVSPLPEEIRQDGREIIERLETTNRASPGFLSTAGRAATGIQLSSRERTENTRTIKERVRSTENLSGKGLLAADLIKNLQSQLKPPTNAPNPRAVSAGMRGKSSDKIPSERPHSENSTRMLTPFVNNNFSRRGSLPAPTLQQKSREARNILRRYSRGNQDENGIVEHIHDEGSLPSLRKVSSANRLSTIHHERSEAYESDRVTGNSMLDVKNYRRRASINIPSERSQRPMTSGGRVQRLGGKDWRTGSSKDRDQGAKSVSNEKMHVDALQMKNTGKIAHDDQGKSSRKKKGLQDMTGLSVKSQINKEESTSSSSDSDAEDEVEKSRTIKKNEAPIPNRNVKVSKKGRNEKQNDSIEDSNGEDEKQKSNSDDDTDEEEESEDSSNESNSESEEEEEEKGNAERKNIVKDVKDVCEKSDDSESEDETEEKVPNLDSLLVDEDLEEFSKQIAAPGMPAVDLLETQEKFAKEGLINKQKAKKKAKKVEESDDEAADELNDLIDDIDDLIDADDDDIAYNNKTRKKKSFVKEVKMVMLINRATLKDK